MKYNYFIVENGADKKTDRKTFILWIKDFCRTTFNDDGEVTTKSNYSDISTGYNPQGILIAWKELAN